MWRRSNSPGRDDGAGMLRNYDICARYGGEEFIVILPETEIEAATLVAERIRQAVEQLQIEWEASCIAQP